MTKRRAVDAKNMLHSLRTTDLSLIYYLYLLWKKHPVFHNFLQIQGHLPTVSSRPKTDSNFLTAAMPDFSLSTSLFLVKSS